MMQTVKFFFYIYAFMMGFMKLNLIRATKFDAGIYGNKAISVTVTDRRSDLFN